MSFVDDIRPILIENLAVFSLIGFTWGKAPNLTKEIRSFRGTFPQGTKLPCITYADSSGFLGEIVTNDLTFLITAWGSDEVECQTVAKAVEDALDSWSGTLNGRPVEKIVKTFWQDSLIEANTNLWYSIRKFEALFW